VTELERCPVATRWPAADQVRPSQHALLSPERWASFSLDQQILMIGNEMNRASRWRSNEDWPGVPLSYERVLRLVLEGGVSAAILCVMARH